MEILSHKTFCRENGATGSQLDGEGGEDGEDGEDAKEP